MDYLIISLPVQKHWHNLSSESFEWNNERAVSAAEAEAKEHEAMLPGIPRRWKDNSPVRIESADVAEDKRSVRIRSRNQLRTLEYTKKDGRLPPRGNGNRRKTEFRQGVNGDYLLWVEDGRFCMYDRGCIDNEEEERTK